MLAGDVSLRIDVLADDALFDDRAIVGASKQVTSAKKAAAAAKSLRASRRPQGEMECGIGFALRGSRVSAHDSICLWL